MTIEVIPGDEKKLLTSVGIFDTSFIAQVRAIIFKVSNGEIVYKFTQFVNSETSKEKLVDFVDELVYKFRHKLAPENFKAVFTILDEE